MMIDTSFFTLSSGRGETKRSDGSRLRPSGSVLAVFGLASAKQTFLPPGVAAYAPQSPYWPSKVGWTSPAVGAAVAALGAAAAGGLAGCAAAAGGLAGCAAAGGLAAGWAGCCASAAGVSHARMNAVAANLLPVIGPTSVTLAREKGQPLSTMDCLRNSAM